MEHLRIRPLAKRAYHAASQVPSVLSLAAWAVRHPQQARKISELMERPIVIGGCGRSGTSLLLAIVSCHPQIFAVDYETMAFCPDAYSRDPDLSQSFRLDWLWRRMARLQVPEACLRVCEKTPKNVLAFGNILKKFGDKARLIHIVRDGRAVVTSRHPTAVDRYHVPVQRWIDEVEAGVAFYDHPCVTTIRYEDVVENYEQTLHRLCEFIGLPFAPELLGYPETAKVKSHVAWSSEAERITVLRRDWEDPAHAAVVSELVSSPRARALLARFAYV